MEYFYSHIAENDLNRDFIVALRNYAEEVKEQIYLLQHLFNNWYRDLAIDKMSAAAVITGLVIMALILLLQRAWEGDA